ncbi:serine/threonine protein kinase [Chengkuizengella sediminis]|uniref:serine/threonine protein kinase n=1 Tax=Chengkuizengella sediminis TaxID=1885917 RepID=UPI00138A580E|nr:serine/threonine-protein kinase [Chengkuizengella sediminis]NDI35585.1 serine/threonine protein kinase [Chengkuizengella sediminis]
MNQNHLNPKDCLGNRYRILSIIGHGGMGAVYLAEDLKLRGKHWAIKESKENGQVKNFKKEAETLIQLNHPYLPNIVDYFPPNEKGLSYLVMDYIHGQNLAQKFKNMGNRLPFEKVIKYAIQICELLHYLHHHSKNPIIYRDLKPSNVMIDQQDNVRLIDFGISRRFGHHKQKDTVHLGTVGFAAPEQFEDKQTDHRTDLFNLGAMLYYFLTRGHYYTSSKSLQLQNIPFPMIQVIQRLLQFNPEDRYQDTLQVKRDLEKLQITEQSLDSPNNTSLEVSLQFEHKVIVVGNMYQGAGSTFTSIALARVFHHYKIKNALVEYPTNVSELYTLLNGEKTKPKQYEFLYDKYNSERWISNKLEWTTGYTTWYPLPLLNNTQLIKNGSHTEIDPLLFKIRKPIMIVDISNGWSHPSVQQLCNNADEICYVVDSIPTKFSAGISQDNLKIAMQLKQSGKNVHFIVNRDVNAMIRKLWNNTLPWYPSCYIPNFPFENVHEHIWKGKMVQDEKNIKGKLIEGLYPFISQIVPKSMLERQDNKMNRLRKWFQIQN